MNRQLTLGAVAAPAMAGGQANAVNAANDAPASAADIIFSNVPTSGSQYSGLGIRVSGPTATTARPVTDEAANAFTPDGNFMLTQIEVGITFNPGSISGTPSNSFMLSLERTTSAGLPDNIPIVSFPLTDLPTLSESHNRIVPAQTVKLTSPVEVLNGIEHWLVASPTLSNSQGTWANNLTGSTAPSAHRTPDFGSGAWTMVSPAKAFAVLGTPVGVGVPEPARSACWFSGCSVPHSQAANAGADR